MGRTERARKNLRRKIKLEKQFLRELATYETSVVKLFRSWVKKVRSPMPIEEYHDLTVKVMEKQYVRVSNGFKVEMREEKSFSIPDKKQDADAVDVAVDLLIAETLLIRPLIIDETTYGDMTSSIASANEEGGFSLSNTTFALLASRFLKNKLKSRRSSISATETQNIAEKTKRIEANVMANRDPINGVFLLSPDPEKPLFKTWAAVFDGNTRSSHASADGQKRHVDDPFIVNGERLMEPGDSSLGASAKNTIHCRCSALYSLR